MGCKNQGAKNRVIVTQKEKRQCKKQGHCLFSFFLTMFLFSASCFLKPIFWTKLFSGAQTNPHFQKNNSGCRLIGCLGKKQET